MAEKPPPYTDAAGFGGDDTNTSPQEATTVYGPALHKPDTSYLRTVCGISKIVQMVVCLIGFIINMNVWYPGGGFAGFSTITGMIESIIWFVLHLVHAIPQIIANYYIELIMYSIIDLFLFISAIIAAANGWIDPAIGAVSFLCFIATVAFGVDTFFQIVDIRNKFSARNSDQRTVA